MPVWCSSPLSRPKRTRGRDGTPNGASISLHQRRDQRQRQGLFVTQQSLISGSDVQFHLRMFASQLLTVCVRSLLGPLTGLLAPGRREAAVLLGASVRGPWLSEDSLAQDAAGTVRLPGCVPGCLAWLVLTGCLGLFPGHPSSLGGQARGRMSRTRLSVGHGEEKANSLFSSLCSALTAPQAQD